ncbi:unnamed protein product, partial [marine sediment metagenome]
LFGERPDMGEGDFMPFHNARLFLPDNMSKRGRENAISVLEGVYQKLEKADETATFGGDIHFASGMASNVGGLYDTINKDIKVNPRISRSDENVFSLLHEYGHKRMYEQMSEAQHQEIKEQFLELRRSGESHMEDIDYASAVQDVLDRLQPGTEVNYIGREKRRKNDPHYQVKSINMYKGQLAIILTRPTRNNDTVDIAYAHNFLDPKKWSIPTLGTERPKQKEKWQVHSDEWFPSQYSETSWHEWWAEMYAFYTHGNLGGDPAAWMKGMLRGD